MLTRHYPLLTTQADRSACMQQGLACSDAVFITVTILAVVKWATLSNDCST